jgi:hypothetical protein
MNMDNRTDQLFKDKLGDHRLPPSAEAWSKVEAGLPKKNKLIILWRVAAAFVLFGLLTGAWFYWQSGQQDPPQQLVKNPSGTDNNGLDEPLIARQEKEENKTQVAAVEKTKEIKKVKSNITEDTQEKIADQITNENLLIEETELVADTKMIPFEPQEKLEKPIVIEFTLEPLPIRTSVAQANGKDEKNNGFEKILHKARDIKNGDSELGSLRDAKNELFALDFRKDKTKRN